jgi:hypothetical protein
MPRVYAHQYIDLGGEIHDLRVYFIGLEGDLKPPPDPKEAQVWKEKRRRDEEEVKQSLTRVLNLCVDLKLPVATELVTAKIKHLPKNIEEYELLLAAVTAELKTRLFLFVPEHRAYLFEKKDLMSDAARTRFPEAIGDLRDSANALAIGFYTASVFHAVRALEIGMRSLAVSLGVEFSFPLEQADWHSIIEQMESKVRAMKDLSKSAVKDADLKFYSETAMQFRYFKDAWRIRVSHARENYDDPQATSVLEHALSFFELIASRLSQIHSK